MSKPRHLLSKIGIGLLMATLLVAVFLAIQQTTRSKLAVQAASTYLKSTSTADVLISQSTIELPDFLKPEDNLENGIRRLALPDTTIPERPSMEVTTYEVLPGDNLFKIAEKYGLRPETVLWGNGESYWVGNLTTAFNRSTKSARSS